LNRDLTWPHRFFALQRDFQDAVAVLGRHAGRIDVVWQRDPAPEFAVEALLPVVRRLFLDRQAPLPPRRATGSAGSRD
jgi:hypothetical protein